MCRIRFCTVEGGRWWCVGGLRVMGFMPVYLHMCGDFHSGGISKEYMVYIRLTYHDIYNQVSRKVPKRHIKLTDSKFDSRWSIEEA
jgi:hypothetical protein